MSTTPIARTMYRIYDSYGCLVRKFPTYQAAFNYRIIFGNTGWTIKHQL